MYKKMLSVLLALMLCMTVTAAIAESPDSPSGNYAEVQGSPVSSTGATVPADFVKPDAQLSEAAQKAVEQIKAVTENVVSYFKVDAEALAAVVPEDFDTAALKVSEVVSVAPIAYDETYGDVEVTVKLATAYKEGDVLVVMIGYVDDDGVTQWAPVAATAKADGTVTINFTQEVLSAVGGRDLMMVVLQG